MFSYENCEIFKNIYFEEHLRTTAILKTRIDYEIILLKHFMKYSFRGISWNAKYFHEILLL